jgi:hypothetical protein
MSHWEVVPESALRDLAGWLLSWPWPLTEQAVLDLATAHGWTMLQHRPGSGARWDTGLGMNRSWARVVIIDGVVSKASVTTSQVLPEETPESTAFLRDVFVDQVALVTGRLGEPSSRSPGKQAQVRWLLPNGAVFSVLDVGNSCSWGLRSPEFVQIEADLGRR